jgi:hypothetical protein
VWNNNLTIVGSFGGPIHTYSSNPLTTISTNPYTINASSTFTTGTVNYSSTNTGGISFNTTSSNTFVGPNKRGVLRSLKSKSRGEVTMDSLIDNSENSIETGRVEKGGSSDQSFKTVDKTFNHYTCSTSIWKILPVSQQVFEKQDLKVYCVNCGKKRKKDSDKFCSSCGNKF